MEKANRAKALYDAILQDFEDYGCMNYRDTILKGIPAFFLRYDPVFTPGDHLLTLDYPLLCGNPPLCGVDLILEYLNGIWTEIQFLNRFHPHTVRQLLGRISPSYMELYLDNLCGPMLLHLVGCVFSKEAGCARLPQQPAPDRIHARFSHSDLEEIAAGVTAAVRTALSFPASANMAQECRTAPYFVKAAPGYAVRIKNGIENDCLDAVFSTFAAAPMDVIY